MNLIQVKDKRWLALRRRKPHGEEEVLYFPVVVEALHNCPPTPGTVPSIRIKLRPGVRVWVQPEELFMNSDGSK